jgi:hypothetical protein
MKVLLDANAVGQKRPMRGNPQKVLLDAGRRRQIELIVPELTIQEVVTVWREDAGAALSRARREMRNAGSFGLELSATELDLGAAARDVEARLRADLATANALIAGFPTAGHELLTGRALARRKPFDGNGQNGYRDALLWEIVLEHATSSDELVLVSGDARAFAEGKDGNQLARLLRDEVEERIGTGRAVRLVADPRELADGLALEQEKALFALRTLLRDPSFVAVFEEAADGAIRGRALSDALVGRLAPEPPGAENALDGWILSIDKFGSTVALAAYETIDDRLLAELEVEFVGEPGISFPARHFPGLLLPEDAPPMAVTYAVPSQPFTARLDAVIAIPGASVERVDVVALSEAA